MNASTRQLANLGLLCCALLPGFAPATCPAPASGEKQLLWGDLHVHTVYSLDAYAFGALATPSDAYAYARGQPLRLANGKTTQLDRPLDFVAVTDHAETFDQMHICTDPEYNDGPYCTELRAAWKAREGLRLFADNLLPVVANVPPEQARVCLEPGIDCPAAAKRQWRRVQEAANQANEPCEFTALIGYEWTASPRGLHWHRNVIFRSATVPDEAFGYRRFPEVASLWQQLDRHCKPANGCEVLTIPHNLNWADGGAPFDVETESAEVAAMRQRFERLAEVHQEKGNSECLPAYEAASDEDANDDCAFERLVTNSAKAMMNSEADTPAEERWRLARSTYYRSLLNRGLLLTRRKGSGNSLLLGAIGSTDTHMGTPGNVNKAKYRGSFRFFWGTDEEVLGDTGYNPGGLVAVWAAENSRSAVFDALHRREAYATSGPRISLRFSASHTPGCRANSPSNGLPMGSVLPPEHRGPLWFTLMAGKDRTPLARLQIVKGELRQGRIEERIVDVAAFPEGATAPCRSWQDEAYDPEAPAYWYARVIEQPTPRWSKLLCEARNLCAEHPDADRMTAERAWSSPIWSFPNAI